MNFGIPYQGSKSGIAKILCRNLPEAEHFYDLFGGGFCVTHAMAVLHPKKYKTLHFNEIESDTVELIQRAIAGEFSYERFKPKFVSREEFFAKKDTCAYTRLTWSFGNDQRSYLFGRDIEPYKRSLHNAVVFNEFDETAKKTLGVSRFSEKSSILQRRLFVTRIVKARNPRLKPKRLQRLQQLQQLQQLERLQRLQQLEHMNGIVFTAKDYRDVNIEPNSVVYCDPPYANTSGYLRDFDHGAFWEWAQTSKHPIFISEYKAPQTFPVVFSIKRKTNKSRNGRTSTHHETLFCNPAATLLMESKGLKTFVNTGTTRGYK